MNPEDEARGRRGIPVLLGIAALWGVAVTVAATTGLFSAVAPLLLAPLIVLGIVVPSLAYLLWPAFRATVAAIGLRWISAFHIWRIGAAMIFFWYGAQGLLPEVFVRNAGGGDFIAGCIALGVTLLPASRPRFWALHLFGFADLIVAVGTGLTFFLLHDPRMGAIRTLPLALIPLYGVGISGASHIMAFHLLSRRSSGGEAARATVGA